MIRIAAQADVPAMVAVHLESFPGFFLTFLGKRFLAVLYDRVLISSEAIGFVAEDAFGSVVGFVAGVTLQTGFYRTLLARHWAPFAWASLGSVLRRPTVIPRLLRAFRRSADAQEAASDCLLMSIAVLPQMQSKQVGVELMFAFLSDAHQRGVHAVSLTTDKYGNDRVNSFYERIGFELFRSYETPEGRWMNEYVIDLSTRLLPGEAN
jgi:ribosomal protein S18 acetylase RimI-like enzyme